ncbi:MAG TPA: pentapeptide repeat-containing protein [Solirubrobacterales bacterium]|nr:pentapeptide repeat-containing protein [Solirubrobacterales bacterium]
MGKAIRAPWAAIADLFNGGVSKRFAFFAIALGLVILAAIWFVFDVLPDLAVDGGRLTDNERLQRENDVRTTGLQALAGAVLAIGGAFTAYSVLSTREGQLDERFARSLELMASKDAHVVSGAIFSLERIAVQSRFDRPAVVDVLSGFVRAGAPRSLEGKEAPPEVTTALRVLIRINELWRSPRLDLRETGWKDLSLPSINLSEALLWGSVFDGAIIVGSKFRGANLLEASFERANLIESDFSRAKLSGADLSRASLLGVKMTRADLSRAKLNGASLVGTKLNGADLEIANLSGADLRASSLHRAASLKYAEYTAETQFPEGFDPEEHGMVLAKTPPASPREAEG